MAIILAHITTTQNAVPKRFTLKSVPLGPARITMDKDASNNAILDSFTFPLDRSGNITQVLNAEGTKWVYTYDPRHRVTEGDLSAPNARRNGPRKATLQGKRI